MKHELIFEQKGTWNALNAAFSWLRDNGYDYGSLSGDLPVGVTNGDYSATDFPQKWKNFSVSQKKNIAGTVTGDFREGPICVKIKL